jgi:hypothetical protein
MSLACMSELQVNKLVYVESDIINSLLNSGEALSRFQPFIFVLFSSRLFLFSMRRYNLYAGNILELKIASN